MKILTGNQIREADLQTMRNEPVSSIDLMERASAALSYEIRKRIGPASRIVVFAGKGNNGGDGLAVARILSDDFHVSTVCVFSPEEMTPECRENFFRLPDKVNRLAFNTLPAGFIDGLKERNAVIVDALLGTGVRGAVRGVVADAIGCINASGCRVISLDMPSGLPTEPETVSGAVVEADETLTLEFPKLSLMLPSTGGFAGRLTVVKIGLDSSFIAGSGSEYEYFTPEDVTAGVVRRPVFSHKGNFGHAMIIAGSHGMMGAAVLAAGAALRSGCGLVTAHVPDSERFVIQTVHPSAIVDADPAGCFSILPPAMGRYAAVGVGCGLRQSPETVSAMGRLLECGVPLVIDADAINIIASRPDYWTKIPAGTVFTPHVGELKRLIDTYICIYGGDSVSVSISGNEDMRRMAAVQSMAARLGSVFVVKGAHTMICTPDGRVRFNMTGNPGMAKGGSGDVLTGLIAGLRARGLDAEDAAVAGVMFHGLAGDRAASLKGEESMNASDILDCLLIRG